MKSLSPKSTSIAPASETPMMRQFNALKKDHPDKILFFRMGDFYEMFGDDAIRAAKVLQIVLTSRNKKKADAIPMCGIPLKSYEDYLNKLTAAGLKVAICEQMEDPAQAHGLVRRDVVRIVTPGTTVSPQLIQADQNHFLVAICLRLRQKRVGVAWVDVSTGEFEVLEFATTDIAQIYNFLFQMTPQEILLAQSRSPAETQFLEELTAQLQQIFPQNTANAPPISFIDPYYFDPEASEQLLTAHFKTFNLSGFGIETLTLGIAAAGALLRYLHETQQCELSHLASIRQHSFEKTMLLDETTLSNLEIFESHSTHSQHTLYGVLNQTCTAMGARLLRQWLRQPLLELEAIEQRLDSVGELQEQFIVCEALRGQLKQIQDLPRIAGRISLPVVNIHDMLGLRDSLHPVVELPHFLKNFETPLLKELKAHFDPLQDILKILQTHLAEDPSVKLREGNFMAQGVSEELDELRNLSSNTKQILHELLQTEREKTGISSLKVSRNKVFGYYIEVSNAHRKAMPADYIRKQTLVNAERYITPELKELEEKILGAEERIYELEYELFQALKARLVAQIARIQKTAQDIALVDTLASLAFVAENNNYVRPALAPLQGPRHLRLFKSRHPVIEQIDFAEPFVPNDVELHETDQQIILLTGPNMAGKSTVMRQVALNILMGQCGSYLPAESATFSLVDRVFTRVGATDKLSRGESTFMVEMNEAAAILNNATERSLVILDEIGRGTSTFDGISLAWAIVEHLHALGALTLCATHYHEMTAIARHLHKVKNFNVLIQEEDEQIVFMRKMVAGEADKSYGVHVAQLAGLPNSVIGRALEIMAELEAAAGENRLAPTATQQIEETPADYLVSDNGQLNFFGDDSPYLQELKELNLNDMTPLQALTYLHDLIQRLKS